MRTRSARTSFSARVGGIWLLLCCWVGGGQVMGSPPLEAIAAHRAEFSAYQGQIIRGVEVVVEGASRRRDVTEVVGLEVGEPPLLREVQRYVTLIYRFGAIDDVVAEVEPVEDGVFVRFRVWSAPLVGEIKLFGNRAIRKAKLEAQLTIHSGSVFSESDLELQADRLVRFYYDEGFSQVHVVSTARPIRSGQRDVTFRIKEGPQLRLSNIVFQGNQAISARQLRRALGLTTGRRLRPVELDTRRKALLQFYRHKHYLSARVKAQLDYGEDRQRAALRLDIVEGPRIGFEFYQSHLPSLGPFDGLVTNSILELLPWGREDGEPRKVSWLRRRELLKILELESEQQFSDGFSQEAAGRIQWDMVAHGFDGARVAFERSESPGGQDVRFKFLIDPGRRVRIQRVTFRGNAFFEGRLLKEVFDEAMLRFAPAGVYTEQALDQALPLIGDYYRSNGFLDVGISKMVEVEETPIGPRASIDVRIDEGGRTLVRAIEVSGNTILKKDALAELIQIVPDQPYDPVNVRQTLEKLRKRYASDGYIYAHIVSHREGLTDDETGIKVHIEIDEGIQARFGKIIVRGTRRTRAQVIRRELLIKSGDVYSPQAVEVSRRRLGETGLFEKAPIYPVDGERVRDMIVEIQERPARVVALSGGILLEGFGLDLDGARYDAMFELAHRNLWGLGHRVSGKIELESTYFPAIVSPTASQLPLPDYVSQLGSDFLDYLSSASSRRVVLSYQSPYFLGTHLTSIGSATLFERERLRSYLLHRNSAAWSFSTQEYRARSRLYLQFQVTSRRPDEETEEKVQLWDVDREQRIFLQASAVFLRDNRRGSGFEERGMLFSLRGEVSQALGCEKAWAGVVLAECDGDAPFVWEEKYAQVSGGGTFLTPVRDWLRLEARASAGYLHSFTEDGSVPMEKRFYLGGAGNIRGFIEDSLGPVRYRKKRIPEQIVSGWTTVATGGNVNLYYTLELQYPLEHLSAWFTDLDLSLFHDAGNVYWTGPSRERFEEAVAGDAMEEAYQADVSESCQALFDYRGLRTSAGLGLRYRTAIGPIRLDVGFPLTRFCREIERPWALHFSIGLF